MFGRFTERAQRVFMLAQEEARRLRHPAVGTEHLLLGLLREGEGIAARALQSLGLDLNRVREEVERIVCTRRQPGGRRGRTDPPGQEGSGARP